ncbi:hypothetical protein GN956_G3931 [Arapaima gigas]
MPGIDSLFFCLCVGSLLTESLTMVPVLTQHNVTINCSLNTENVYWYMQPAGKAPLAILRSFADISDVALDFSDFKGKYVLQSHGRLLIQNATDEDCVVFYCAVMKEESLIFSSGIRLNISDTCPGHQNELLDFRLSQCNRLNSHLFIGSIILNGILIVALIVLTKKFSSQWYKPVKKLEPVEDEPLYSVIQIPRQQNPMTNTTKMISTYALLQHPAA